MSNTRTFLRLGCAAALAFPLALSAQERPALPAEAPDADAPADPDDDFAARMGMEVVSTPVVQSVRGFPPAVDPRQAQMMEWPVPAAQGLLAVIEGIDAEGLSPADYRPGALRAAIELGDGPELDSVASQSVRLAGGGSARRTHADGCAPAMVRGRSRSRPSAHRRAHGAGARERRCRGRARLA